MITSSYIPLHKITYCVLSGTLNYSLFTDVHVTHTRMHSGLTGTAILPVSLLTLPLYTSGMHNLFEAKGRKVETHRDESGVRFLGRGSELPPHQLLGGLALGECRKLPQWGPGQSPGCKCILMYFELKNRIWQLLFDYLFQLKKWKWCATSMHFETSGVPSN